MQANKVNKFRNMLRKNMRINSIIGQVLAKIYYVNLTLRTDDGFIQQSSDMAVLGKVCYNISFHVSCMGENHFRAA
jgi:hypothetical protein